MSQRREVPTDDTGPTRQSAYTSSHSDAVIAEAALILASIETGHSSAAEAADTESVDTAEADSDQPDD